MAGVARRHEKVGRLVRVWAAVSAVVVILGLGAEQLASAGGPPSGSAKPVVGAAPRQSRPDVQAGSTAQQCFVSSQPCTSPDPTVAFTMFSSGDTTGCVFKQDTSWGDGTPDTILTYVGGANQTPMATFTHAYSAPGNFVINFAIDVTDNPNLTCGGGPGQLNFTLSAPPSLPCKSSQVTVPASAVPVTLAGQQLSVTYGPTPLAFAPGTASPGEKCAMVPAASVTPIELKIPSLARPIPIGQSDATATIDLFAASSSFMSAIPNCDFGPLQVLPGPGITPPLVDFADTNNCFLTPTYHASWDMVARWTVPNGVVQTAHDQATNSDTDLYSTQPLTYYVDLDTMPLPQGFSGNTMSALVDFIYSTLAQNVPVVDRIALVHGSSRHLLVTNPFGRHVGLDSKNRVHTFAGAGYAEVAGRSIAWILEPRRGNYHITVSGTSGSKFRVDLADLQFLGHGSTPLAENFAWNDFLGGTGTATKRFTVHGTALAPALAPHESTTRIKPLARVFFRLANSVIPLGTIQVLWQFGDGTTAKGAQAAHRYRHPGRYTPAVTVTDAVGYTATVELPVIVVKR